MLLAGTALRICKVKSIVILSTNQYLIEYIYIWMVPLTSTCVVNQCTSYIYIYICVYIYTHDYIYIYKYIYMFIHLNKNSIWGWCLPPMILGMIYGISPQDAGWEEVVEATHEVSSATKHLMKDATLPRCGNGRFNAATITGFLGQYAKVPKLEP